jgi:hypothetical protein
MSTHRVVILSLVMLTGHVAHIFEEIWGRFWLIDVFYGLGWFLVVNWVLFCIPVMLLYFVFQRKRWASTLGMIYAIIMIANGIGHNLGTLVTGRYFGGEAFGFTGIGLVLIGLPLLYTLWQDMPRVESSRPAITPSL